MRKKLQQFEIYKISTDRLTECNGKKIKIVPLTLDKREALERGELVKIQNNQMTNAILGIYRNGNVDISEIIVNVVVPQENKKLGERQYYELAKHGFTLNGNHYVRFVSGSGQIRRNTITFIKEELYETMLNTLLCGLTLSDFGDSFNAAKFNAYCGLNMSGCHLLPDALTPRVCIVDDYEEIRPNNRVNHVTEQVVEYVTLPEDDFILEDGQEMFSIVDGKAVRKSDGVAFTIHKGVNKQIKIAHYDEIEDSPALNSFDGQGLATPEWVQKVADYLGFGYLPSEMTIRAPWVKGLVAVVPFKEYFAERGITEITDAFGEVRQIDDIDCLISKSQFKMHKVYKVKCEKLGVNAWDYHTESMKKNHLKWGIVKKNAKTDDYEKALNYQYLEALMLNDDDVDALCKRTMEFLESLNCGDIKNVYENLVMGAKGFIEDTADCNYKKLYQKVIEANPEMIGDKYIRQQILKECDSKLKGAKLGKLLVRGNFQFCVSDPVAQLQWIEKRHCGSDVDVTGVVPAGCIYSNYWMDAEDCENEIVLMRSPLIDRNEIAKRQLVKEKQPLLRYLTSGLVFSIHDLTALQEGGCDFDGDIIFSTNNKIVAGGCYDYQIARPLYYELHATDLVGKIENENIIQADIRGLNSKVGQISNRSGSLYAMLEGQTEGTETYDTIYDNVISLGQIVGMEIDRIKTAVQPTYPITWQSLQVVYKQKRDDTAEQMICKDESEGVYRHNALVPDRKPYFFRYNYKYLDDSLKELDTAFNKVSVFTFGMKLSELKEKCECGNASEEMLQLYGQYQRAYPLLDTDCVVNHVCHLFEDFEKSLEKKVSSEGVNMLPEFLSGSALDKDIISQVDEMLAGYQRLMRLETKANNSKKDSTQELKKEAYTRLDAIRNHYRNAVLELMNGDMQLAYDYLVTAAKGRVKLVWDILDKDIIAVIGKEQKNGNF